jgi:hypothetical protein
VSDLGNIAEYRAIDRGRIRGAAGIRGKGVMRWSPP